RWKGSCSSCKMDRPPAHLVSFPPCCAPPGTGFAENENKIMPRAMIVEPNRRQRIPRLTPLADVLARLDALVKPVMPRTADLAAALGRTLAEDVVIHAPVPATARALRDGWAVSSDLTTDAGAYAPAPLPSAAWVDVGEALTGRRRR